LVSHISPRICILQSSTPSSLILGTATARRPSRGFLGTALGALHTVYNILYSVYSPKRSTETSPSSRCPVLDSVYLSLGVIYGNVQRHLACGLPLSWVATGEHQRSGPFVLPSQRLSPPACARSRRQALRVDEGFQPAGRVGGQRIILLPI